MAAALANRQFRNTQRTGSTCFLCGFAKKGCGFQSVKGCLAAITDARLQEYGNALPPEWTNDGGVAGEALGYIAQVRDNIDSALAEVARVLT